MKLFPSPINKTFCPFRQRWRWQAHVSSFTSPPSVGWGETCPWCWTHQLPSDLWPRWGERAYFENHLEPGVGGQPTISPTKIESGASDLVGGCRPVVGAWRRLPDLSTRLTPIHLVGSKQIHKKYFENFQVNHCGSLFLVGWQPARLNFILKLNLQGEQVFWHSFLSIWF